MGSIIVLLVTILILLDDDKERHCYTSDKIHINIIELQHEGAMATCTVFCMSFYSHETADQQNEDDAKAKEYFASSPP